MQAMIAAIEQMHAAVRDYDVTAGVEADVLFHRAIAEATGNVALTGLVDSIALQLMKERAAVWSEPSRPQRSLEEHTAIYQGISSGDPIAARSAALAHLESVEQGIAELASRQEGLP